jgi:RNA polymerase sigma factor (sigma-70 family)
MTTGTRVGEHALPPFERVVDLYGPSLLRYCVAHVGASRADDCFQDTMLAALRAYGEVRDAGAVRAWLFSIATRKAIDAHRAHPQSARSDEPVETLPASSAVPHRDDGLWARVSKLPEKQRQAVTLRFLGDLSHREIASVMETTEAAARRNVFEGLTRLRNEMRG